MAKRKASSDEDEHDNSDYPRSAINEEPKSRLKRAAQKKKIVKEESDFEGEGAAVKEENELDEDDAPLATKPKTEPEDANLEKADQQKDTFSDVMVKTSSEGEKYVDLGKKKRATIRSFKGIPLIDIREFYGADGDEKPGKKGISLTLEQWEALKKCTSTLDELFATLKKKK